MKTETKQIGAHVYKVTMLDAIAGRRAFVRFTKLVGPAWQKMQSDEGAAIAQFFEQLEEKDVDYFCDTFAAVTEVSGGQYAKASPQLDTVFSLHFAGDYFSMVAWLVFCVQMNFKSFFVGAGQYIASNLAARAASSNTPKDSTLGPSDS